MKRFLIIVLFLVNLISQGQIQLAAGCNQSSLTVNTFFLPNTTTVYSNNTIPMEVLYLCGPNTIVYDTVIQFHCRNVLINSGCTYYTNSLGCLWADFLLAKNNSTLVISSTGNPSTMKIYYEPGATIINFITAGSTQSVMCTSLTFPSGSCTSAGIKESNWQEPIVVIYPNPASSRLNIESVNFSSSTIEISIINQFGQIIYLKKEWPISDKEIPINDIGNGLYYVQVKTANSQRTEKLIIDR